jgi:hypothetical protein
MRRPWIIGALSIVPGLGIIALGRIVPGLAVMASIAVLGFLALLDPAGTIAQLAFSVGLIIWVTQGYYAIALARRLAQSRSGSTIPEREAATEPLPPGASFADKRAHEARMAVAPLLEPSETLRVVIHGSTDTTPIGLALMDLVTGASSDQPESRQLYLGITEHDLVLVEIDAFGKPSHLQRIPLAKVKLGEFRQGILSDVLALDVDASQSLRIGVARMMRQRTRQLADLIPH